MISVLTRSSPAGSSADVSAVLGSVGAASTDPHRRTGPGRGSSPLGRGCGAAGACAWCWCWTVLWEVSSDFLLCPSVVP